VEGWKEQEVFQAELRLPGQGAERARLASRGSSSSRELRSILEDVKMRPDKARQGKTRQDKARQGKTRAKRHTQKMGEVHKGGTFGDVGGTVTPVTASHTA
jgi:hypothetical protein